MEIHQNKIDGKFHQWIHCMCVVTFDLELGQALELIYPENSILTEQEKTNICYLAFPDSNSGCMGDTQYHVRLRLSPCEHDDDDSLQLNLQQRTFLKNCIVVQKPDLGHYWGFVYFRQKKDKTIPRGYFQKSFIILTRLPFFNLFYELLSQIAPRYFNDGKTILTEIYNQIETEWPDLRVGESYSLRLFGNIYQTIIPKSNSKSHSSATTNSLLNDNSKSQQKNKNLENESNNKTTGPTLVPQVLSTVHELDIFRSLSNFLPNIFTLWELVLTAEPIIVLGTSPASCSYMVQSLVSLISPLAYCSEFRPYFTIHDSEFKEFTSTLDVHDSSQQLSIILGVTNPFFSKLLQNWPHMLKLADAVNQQFQHQISTKLSGPSTSSTALDNTLTINSAVAAKRKQIANSLSINSINLNGNLSVSCDQPGLYTKYKPFLKKDKQLIKKIQLGVKTKRPEQVQSALLRRHLLELTQSFMIPLERYMASLMPLQKDISPFKSAPNPNQFKQDDFLATLELSGPHLTSPLKGNWKGLYQKFFKSVNFRGWYEMRHKELQQTLQALQLQALSDADLNQWAQGKQEVEIIDMILKLKKKLSLCSDSQILIEDVLKSTTRQQLIKQLDNITQSLPDDLKNILNNSS